MSTIVLLACAVLPPAPGRSAILVRTGPAGTELREFVEGARLDDTTLNLCGRWGVAVNVGNFDFDPEPEIVCRLSQVAANDLNITKLSVLDNDLNLMWSDSWGYSGNPEMASPCLADIDHDGRDEIIVSMAETFFPDPPAYPCRIYVLDGMTGEVKPGWPFVMPGYPDFPYHDVHSEPAAADIDRDDTVEIVLQVDDLGSIRKPGAGLYVLRPDGESLWKYIFYSDTLDRHGAYTSPAVGDLDHDGRLEIVCHAGHFRREWPYPVVEKRLWIMNHDGTVRRQWQTEGPGGDYTPDYASPALGDINADGVPEIVLALRRGILAVYDTAGNLLSGFPKDLTADAGYYPANPVTRAFSTPALADLNQDGSPEIILGTSGRERDNTRWAGRVHAFKADGAALHGFPVRTRNAIWYSPGAADLNGDAALEIATAGCDSAFYVIKSDGDSLAGWPLRHFPTYWLPDVGSYAFLEGIIPMSRTPFLLDLDADGRTEILMEGRDGRFYIWESEGLPLPPRRPCPTFRFNKERTGWFDDAVLGVESRAGRTGTIHGIPSGPDGSVVSAGSVDLLLTSPGFRSTEVSVFDRTGRLARTLRQHAVPGLNRVNLPLAGLSPGVFLLRIRGVSESIRLVVLR
jgi:hypothetical protein